MLTGQVREAETIEMLPGRCSARENHLNHIHLSACWISLSRAEAKQRGLQMNAEALEPLVQHTLQAARAGEIDARQLVNIVYEAPRSSVRKRLNVLFTALARAAERRMCEFKAQELANTAWAFATASQPDTSLFTALARAAEWRMCEFKAQELANAAWAFATAGQLDASLFTALARAAKWRMCEFIAQEVANTAWAFATAGQLDASLFMALARAS